MRSTSNDPRDKTYQYDRSSDDDDLDCADSDASSDASSSMAVMTQKCGTPPNPLTSDSHANTSVNANQHAAANITMSAMSAHNPLVVRLRPDSASSSIVSEDDSENESADLHSKEIYDDSEVSEENSSLPDDDQRDDISTVIGHHNTLRIGIKQNNYGSQVNLISVDAHTRKLTIDLGGYDAIDAAVAKQRLAMLGTAISKNVSIREIEINNKSYDADLDNLFEALSQNPRLESLSINLCDADRLTVLTDKLATNRTLKKLNLRSVNHPDSALAKSIHALVSSNPALTTLHFSDNAFVEHLLPADRAHERPDFSPLMKLVSASGTLTDLTICLRSYSLTKAELSGFQESLQINKTLKNLQLTLTYNTFIADGMAAVAAALDYHPTLASLHLDSDSSRGARNPDDGSTLAIALANTIPHLPCLHTLTIGFPIDEKGAAALGNSLLVSGIRTLSLQFYWKKEVASTLLQAMEAHKHLQSLELSVGPSHIIPHLARLLEKNASLTRMVIDFVESTSDSEENYQSLVSAINRNFQLTVYDDKNSSFSPENDVRIAGILTRNLQLLRVPQAAKRLSNMMKIALPTSHQTSAVSELPLEILEQVIAAMIIHAKTRRDAQIVLDAFMLENTVRVEEVDDDSN